MLNKFLILKYLLYLYFIIVNAKIFEFSLNENIIEGFQIKGTLLDAIPDYISLGYDKEDTKMKFKGSPIRLNLNLRILTKLIWLIFLINKKINYGQFKHLFLS